MKCYECGHKMNVRTGVHRYNEAQFPVTLVGVEIRECPNCGDREVEIPRVEELHHTIATILIRKESPLVAAEVKFLRKLLGWSSTDLARRMGVDKATVSRWENENNQIGPQSDRLLRCLAALSHPIEDYAVNDAMDAIDDNAEPKPVAVSLKMEKGWKIAA